MKQLRFVCAQPAIDYYSWQVEVMLNNFMDMGVNLNYIDVVCKLETDRVPENWDKLRRNYAARFFFYRDTRITRNYISSIRPNILKQHWQANPHLVSEAIFYHDCDIAFTRPIREWITDAMLADNKWYGSDCRWYIAHSYIRSKGQDVVDKMCEITGLPESLIEQNELNAIGAQYLMKNIDADYWAQVERDCEELFHQVSALNQRKKAADPGHHELQIWCADMWAVLWGAWRRGYETECHPNFEFSWATGTAAEYQRCNIFHNAGVTSNREGRFYKAEYMHRHPYDDELEIRQDTGSWHYWQLIKSVGRKSVLK
jgi:hypothetical protein